LDKASQHDSQRVSDRLIGLSDRLGREFVMDLIAGSAMLGGMLASAAFGWWTRSKWPGLAAQPATAPLVPIQTKSGEMAAPSAAAPSAIPTPQQQHVRDARLQALEDPVSLRALHEEVSAIRRQERIFARLAPDAAPIGYQQAREAKLWASLSLIGGQPACTAPGTEAIAPRCATTHSNGPVVLPVC